jgi:hypothetical protein
MAEIPVQSDKPIQEKTPNDLGISNLDSIPKPVVLAAFHGGPSPEAYGFPIWKVQTQGETHTGPVFPLKDKYGPETGYELSTSPRSSAKLATPTVRALELRAQANELVRAAAQPDGSMGLRDFGQIMQKIAADKGLSEADKWYLYMQVRNLVKQGRDSVDELIPGTTKYRVLFERQPPTGLSEPTEGDVVRHIIISPTDDGYHGLLVYGSPSWESCFLPGESGILCHERFGKPLKNTITGRSFFGRDPGAEQASFRQLAAIRAMQKGGFDAYSKVWNQQFGQ